MIFITYSKMAKISIWFNFLGGFGLTIFQAATVKKQTSEKYTKNEPLYDRLYYQ